MEMEGLVAVITGSARGLGKTIAERLFYEGARVSLWDIDPETVDQLSRQFDPAGVTAAAVGNIQLPRELLEPTAIKRGQQRRYMSHYRRGPTYWLVY